MDRRRLAQGIDLYHPRTESETADLVQAAVEKSVPIIRESWGLETPDQCRVVVMTGWFSFLLSTAPPYLWPAYALSVPFAIGRLRRVWRHSGGWMQPYWRRPTVGVKPARLLDQADQSIGDQLFVRDADVGKRVEQVACHELTHAFSAHLKLPLWLNEGIAMLTVDRYVGRPTVKPESLKLLQAPKSDARPAQYRRLAQADEQEMARQYARAYWLARFIDERQPGLLRQLLAQPLSRHAMEARVADALDVPSKDLWQRVDRLIGLRFSGAAQ